MSAIGNENVRHTVYGGIVVDVAQEGLDRALRIMQGFPGEAAKAVGHALARAASTGKTEAKRQVVKEYTLSGATFAAYTRNVNHISGGAGGLSVVFGFAGRVIPLLKFETKATDHGVVTNVRRSTGAQVLHSAFRRSMNGHEGIYEREGASRLPVRELFGPSTPQMMYSNEEVLDRMEEKMAETFEKRIDHEILRIMNGWGK